MNRKKWLLVGLLILHMILQSKETILFLALFVIDSATVQYQNISQFLTILVSENFNSVLLNLLFTLAQVIGILGLIKEKKWAFVLVLGLCFMSVLINLTVHIECTILALLIAMILLMGLVKKVD